MSSSAADRAGTLSRSVHRGIETAPRFLFTSLRYTLGLWLRWRFRVRIHYDTYSANLRPPFVVLANHVNFWDPFLVAMPFGPPVHFIAADGNSRGQVMRILMALAGTIPKAKAKNDLESIRTLQLLIRHRKIVGIFPEGQRSWDGTSRPVLPGTPKLVRLLGAPVVSVRLKGGYLSQPRWAHNIRRGILDLHVTTVVTADEVKKLGKTDVTERIAHSVDHSETDWQRTTGRLFIHPRRAEHIEKALFYCPDCGAWGTIRSEQAEFQCTSCESRSWIAPSGKIYAIHNSAGLRYRHRTPDSVSAWNTLQRSALERSIATLADPVEPTGLTSPTDTTSPLPVVVPSADFLTGYRSRPLSSHGTATVELTARHFTITPAAAAPSRRNIPTPAPSGAAATTVTGATISIPVNEITAIHVQYSQQLEFYWRRRLYVLRMKRPEDSAYRLEETVLTLQQHSLRY
ncbi:MAG: lysophospholipid acyltransferase family protein [Alkalispirochaeta sp.]